MLRKKNAGGGAICRRGNHICSTHTSYFPSSDVGSWEPWEIGSPLPPSKTPAFPYPEKQGQSCSHTGKQDRYTKGCTLCMLRFIKQSWSPANVQQAVLELRKFQICGRRELLTWINPNISSYLWAQSAWTERLTL